MISTGRCSRSNSPATFATRGRKRPTLETPRPIFTGFIRDPTRPPRLAPASDSLGRARSTYFATRPFVTSLTRLNIAVMSAYFGSETSKYFLPAIVQLIGTIGISSLRTVTGQRWEDVG